MIIDWILVTFFFVHFKWWINHFVSSNVIEIGVWALSSYLQKLAFLPPKMQSTEGIYAYWWFLEINEDQVNESKQSLLIQMLL